MAKVTKTIKIETSHEEWLQSKKINFSAWVRTKLDTEIELHQKGGNQQEFRAIILAAGKDTDLFPLTEDKPKSLLEVKGKTILEWQIEALRSVNINEIAVVRGYRKEKINFPNLKYFDNDNYENTGSLASLFSAMEFIDENVVVLYGDILFAAETLSKLIASPDNTILVVDRGWKKYYQDSQEAHPFPPELTAVSGSRPMITAASVNLQHTDSTCEFIGLAKLSVTATSILRETYKNQYQHNVQSRYYSAKNIQVANFINFIEELIDLDETVIPLEIWRNWIDIDTFEDYRRAWHLIDEIMEREK